MSGSVQNGSPFKSTKAWKFDTSSAFSRSRLGCKGMFTVKVKIFPLSWILCMETCGLLWWFTSLHTSIMGLSFQEYEACSTPVKYYCSRHWPARCQPEKGQTITGTILHCLICTTILELNTRKTSTSTHMTISPAYYAQGGNWKSTDFIKAHIFLSVLITNVIFQITQRCGIFEIKCMH